MPVDLVFRSEAAADAVEIGVGVPFELIIAVFHAIPVGLAGGIVEDVAGLGEDVGRQVV